MRTILLTFAALLCVSVPAQAEVAKLTAAVNVVTMAAPGSDRFERVRSGASIEAGARLRTGARSRAAIQFEDESILAINELSEVVIASGRRRDIRITRGQVMGDFKSPGTITGGYAVASVRGTTVIVIEDPENQQTIVQNYDGETVVAGPGIQIRSGRAAPPPPNGDEAAAHDDQPGANQFTDPNLIGDDYNWTGATLRILAGLGAGEERRVTAFDPATGTVSFQPPIQQGLDHTSLYLLISDPQAQVAELRSGAAVSFRPGRPIDHFRLGSIRFAGGQKTPWYEPLVEAPSQRAGAVAEVVTARTITHDALPEDRASSDGTQSIMGGLLGVPDTSDDRIWQDCFFTTMGILPPPDNGLRQHEEGHACAHHAPAGLRLQALADGGPLGLPALENGSLFRQDPQPGVDWFLRPPDYGVTAPGREFVFFLEPFALAARGENTAGIRARLAGATGRLYTEMGGLFRVQQGRFESDISEAYLVYKTGRTGELRAGRQPLFLSPAQNLTLGTLLGLETADAALYRSPWLGAYRVDVGYLFDSNGYQPGGFSGWFGRVERPFLRGALGANVLTANRAGTQVGWSADLAVPVGDDLHLYGEAGRDPFHNNLYTAGAYFPQLYQRAGLDVFLEYATRRGLPREVGPERIQLRVRRSVAGRFHAIGFLDQEIGGRLRPGGGFVYTHAFR